MGTSLQSLVRLNAIEQATGLKRRTVQGWIDVNLRGFRDRCVLKVGGRLFVDVMEMTSWVEEWRGRDGKEAAGQLVAPEVA